MSFKILALRPHINCTGLKNLIPDHQYKFYNNFDYNDDKFISEIDDVPKNLYNSDEKQNISISAIVGKNGSGKSALIELLTKSILKVSLLLKENFVNEDELFKTEKERIIYRESVKTDLSTLQLDFYYLTKGDHLLIDEDGKLKPHYSKKAIIRKVVLNCNNVSFTDYIKNGDIFVKSITYDLAVIQSSEYVEEFLEDFFYTIITNYSFYGFNNKDVGAWIEGIFHKNDGYQLPVVINPYRINGNIDINTEKTLTNDRFLVNILQEPLLRNITDKKELSHILISLNDHKFRYINDNIESRFTNSEEEKIAILKFLVKSFYSVDLDLKIDNDFFNHILEYILNKIFKITNYSFYKKYSSNLNLDKEDDSLLFINFDDTLRHYFSLLSEDTSHNTFKLRQALYYSITGYLSRTDISNIKNLDHLSSKISEGFDLIKSSLNDSEGKEIFGPEFSVNESLPSIFNTELYFSADVNSKNTFTHMSSGEKQKIFSISSVVYHLRNLFSISKMIGTENVEKIIPYNNVNIVFDEIELYFHPQFQKAFIKDLLKSLEVLDHSYTKRLNIIFLTHSPFILSDIPKQNVLFLNDGKDEYFRNGNTFAANISTLLSDSFFVNNGLIGDYAIKRINETIEFINTGDKTIPFEQSDFHKLILLIDEPILQQKLIEMYVNKFQKKSKLEFLEKQLNEIQQQIKGIRDSENSND